MGYIGNCFKAFIDNTSNDISSIPDVSTLSAKEWNAVSPKEKKILMDSDKNMPEFAKKVLNYLREKFRSIPQRINSLGTNKTITNKTITNKTENRINREVNDSKDGELHEEDNEIGK